MVFATDVFQLNTKRNNADGCAISTSVGSALCVKLPSSWHVQGHKVLKRHTDNMVDAFSCAEECGGVTRQSMARCEPRPLRHTRLEESSRAV